MDFNATLRAYANLKEQFDQGNLSGDEFEKRVNDMTVTDAQGTLWQIGVKTGKWYRYDGVSWVEDTPSAGVAPARPSAPIPAPRPQYAPVQPAPRPFNWLWVGGGLAALALVGCVVVVLVVFVFNQDKPLPNNVVVAEPITTERVVNPPPPVVPVTVASPGQILFQDDFSNPSSGWEDIRVGPDFNTLYFEGAYLFVINSANFHAWANPGKNFPSDVQVEVDARKTSGSQNDEYGLICRYVDNSDGTSSYYFLSMTTYGAGLVYKVDHDAALIITSPQTAPMSGIVLLGDQVNRIRADCVGDMLTLWVNGILLNKVTDSSFNAGDVGLRVNSDTGGTEIRFDNFSVSPR